ncbi:aKG-HExxH-type peptide beta-hydroxylase [Streptomyces anulatus]
MTEGLAIGVRHGSVRAMMNRAEREEGRMGGGREQGERDRALAVLRAMLADALAASRLSKTLLASRAGLGRTTVHEALRASAPAPSAETVVAMARALGMAREERSELLGLRRTAAGPLPAAEEEPAAGRGAQWAAAPDLVETPADHVQTRPPPVEAMAPITLPQRRVPADRLRGRDDLVAELTAAATGSGSGSAQERPGVWLLSGMGGSGKTTVALETAHRLVDAQCRVWWVSGADDSELMSALRTVAFAAGARPSDFSRAHPADVLWNRLDALTTPWLLVLDNIDDPAVLSSGAPVARGTGWLRKPANRWGTVLITSRESREGRWGPWVRNESVGLLSSRDGARVLLDTAPQAGTAGEARKLAEHLGGLPLALDLAGSYLARALESAWPSPSVPDTFPAYRASLDARLADMASDPDRDLEPRERTRRALVSTWELSLDHLHEQGIGLARPLLRLLCAFGPAPLPYMELLDPELLARSELFEDPHHARLAEALNGLAGLRLVTIERTREGEASPGPGVQRWLTIHPMVRAAGRAHPDFTAKATEMLALVTDLLLGVTGPLRLADPADWPVWRAIAPHCGAARVLLQICEPQLGEDIDQHLVAAATEPSVGAAQYHNIAGMYGAAIAELNTVCSLRARLLGESHPATIAVRLHLAWALRDNGDLTEADRLYQEVALAASEAMPPGHPYLQSARTGRGRVLRELGHYQEAEEELLTALEMRRRDPRGTPVGILRIRHALAMLADKRGRHGEAVAELRDILQQFRALVAQGLPGVPSAEIHLDALAVQVGLARALRDAGHAAEAAATAEDVVLEYERVLEPDHPHVLLARHERARILRDHESDPRLLKRARDEFTDIWKTNELRLGADHPDVIATRHELGTVWHLLGRPDLAAEHFRAALEAGRRRLGEDHPDVLVSGLNLADVLAEPPPRLAEGESTMDDEHDDRNADPSGPDLASLTMLSALSAEHGDEGLPALPARVMARFIHPRLSRGGSNPGDGGYSRAYPAPKRSARTQNPPSHTYRPGAGDSPGRPSGSVFPSTPDLRALATGREDPALIEQLRIRQRGTRLLALRSVLNRADRLGNRRGTSLPAFRSARSRADRLGDIGTGRLPMAEQVRALLLEADRADSEAVTKVLLHPSVGRWLSKTLRTPDPGRLPDEASGPRQADEDLSHLHAVAAAAAIRAGVPFTLPIPVRDGFAVLPTLGTADLRPAGSTTAHIKASEDGAEITSGGTRIRLPRQDDPVPPGWIPLESVRTPVGLRSFDLALDDMDPYRETEGPVPPCRLSPPESDRWKQLTGEAQLLLAATDRREAVTMAVALTTLTPRPAEPGGVMTSISGSDAFGGIVLSAPPDAVDLAVTLVHEFRHMKLNAVLDTVDLYKEEGGEDRAGSLYYAPWRDDPRPLHGLFHGVFAFFGVVDFWCGLIRSAEGEALRRSQFQMAYWRRQASDAHTTLLKSPRLTANGMLFATMMTRSLDNWSEAGPLPEDVAVLAEEAVLTHRVRWRLHHLRPDPSAVAELAEAWLSGAPRSPEPAVAVTVCPDPGVPSLGEHTVLLCRAACERRTEGEHPLPAGPWARLLVTARRRGAHDAAQEAVVRSLSHGPEVVRAVHDRVAAITNTAPDLLALAAWMGTGDDRGRPGLPVMNFGQAVFGP